jgi:hypothetical protein
MDLNDINIGYMIKNRVADLEIEIPRICKFFSLSEIEIAKMYENRSLDTEILLKWSKLLEYDFFKFYSQQLILDPQGMRREYKDLKSALPRFKKKTYTKEMIEFLMEHIKTGRKTKQQIIEEYMIPRATLNNWINRYRK